MAAFEKIHALLQSIEMALPVMALDGDGKQFVVRIYFSKVFGQHIHNGIDLIGICVCNTFQQGTQWDVFHIFTPDLHTL